MTKIETVSRYSELPPEQQKLRTEFADKAFARANELGGVDTDIGGNLNIATNRIVSSTAKYLTPATLTKTVHDVFGEKEALPILDELKPILCALIAKPE